MTVRKSDREPFVHLTKRAPISTLAGLLIRAGAFVLAVLFCAIIVWIMIGVDPLTFLKTMFTGSLGIQRLEKATDFNSFWRIFTSSYFWTTVKTGCKLLLLAVALAPAFKMKFWNIGAEGQVLMGALAAAACMFYFGKTRMPNWLLLILMFAASLFFGILWAIIPAIFKAAWNTNETLFTLMMNYVAMQLIQVCVSIWAPNGSGVMGHINPDTYKGWLPDVFGQKYLINIVFVTLLTGILFVYLTFSKHGYEISVVGESENTARYIGIKVKKVILRTMALSGMICGFAGFLLVAGENHTITKDLAGGMGFTAIMVAWLAKFNTFVMILISLLLVFLEAGAGQIASDYNLNEYASKIIIGIILFFILGSEFFINYRLVFRRKESVR